MAKKPGLTFERHEEIGAELKDIQRRLMALAVELGKAYPKNGVTCRQLARAGKAVGAARCQAEADMFREHPKQADTRVYYGGN